MSQPHSQPMAQANFTYGLPQSDEKTNPPYAAQQPMYQTQAPMFQTQAAYTYQPQHQPSFNAGQPYGTQQPMAPTQYTGYQNKSQFHSGPSIQVSPASHPAQFFQPIRDRADSMLTSIHPQYTADTSPPPPPYTSSSSSTQAYPQYQSTDEKSPRSSVPTIDVQQTFDRQQPSAPHLTPPEVHPPPVTVTVAPSSTPVMPRPQELPVFSTASPPSAPATPVRPVTTQTPQDAQQIHVSEATTNPAQPQGLPPSQTGAAYGASPTSERIPQPMTTQTPQPLQSTPQTFQAPQPVQPTPQTYSQHQAAQPSFQGHPSQQQTYGAPPTPVSPPTQQPMSNIPLQQFSRMSINPFPTPVPSYTQPNPQLQQYTNPPHCQNNKVY